MNWKLVVALASLGAVAVVSARSLEASREAERVPYELVDTVDGIELRQYPTTLTVETAAANGRVAFGRLFGYIAGGNEGRTDIAMTTPVATGGTEIAMTAPVETEQTGGEMRMAFYLPSSLTYETAPSPTDDRVSLVEHPARMLAVRSFSWWATDGRTRRQERKLLEALAARDVEVVGDPFLLQYDAPWTPPFLRTNEVAVEVRRRKSA